MIEIEMINSDYYHDVRLCWRCDQPLPVNYHHNRHMHPECAHENRLESNRLSRQLAGIRRRYNASHPHKKRDPMLGISPEYVALKLAGKINIPKRDPRHIFTEPRKYKDD
jgi:hypothetical protein